MVAPHAAAYLGKSGSTTPAAARSATVRAESGGSRLLTTSRLSAWTFAASQAARESEVISHVLGISSASAKATGVQQAILPARNAAKMVSRVSAATRRSLVAM